MELSIESKMQSIIEPVISEMPDSELRHSLLDSFRQEENSLRIIENTFTLLTKEPQERDSLKLFFHSWSKTNNSAMSVSGLASRITLMAREAQDPKIEHNLFKVCSSLQRITDEDLGVYGGFLHSDLFYRMATKICGDDSWLSKSFCLKSANEFKEWTDQKRLQEKEIIHGLLTTLIHEIYTHGEIEYIYPLYKNWFETHLDIEPSQVRNTLAWVTVHTGGTESHHFKHAVDAVQLFCDTMNIRCTKKTLSLIFTEYLQHKARVMAECGKHLKGLLSYQLMKNITQLDYVAQ